MGGFPDIFPIAPFAVPLPLPCSLSPFLSASLPPFLPFYLSLPCVYPSLLEHMLVMLWWLSYCGGEPVAGMCQQEGDKAEMQVSLSLPLPPLQRCTKNLQRPPLGFYQSSTMSTESSELLTDCVCVHELMLKICPYNAYLCSVALSCFSKDASIPISIRKGQWPPPAAIHCERVVRHQ